MSIKNRMLAGFCLLLALAACEQEPGAGTMPDNEFARPADQHDTVRAEVTQQQGLPEQFQITDTAADAGGFEEPVVPDETAHSDETERSVDDRFNEFMQQSEEGQSTLTLDITGSSNDGLLVMRLLGENIPTDIKLELLEALRNGDYVDIAPALNVALHSSSRPVVITGIDILGTTGSTEEIPLLRKLLDTSQDETIREAAQNAIEMLQ